MDLSALLFDVNDVLRRFSAGRGSEVEAQKLAVAFRVLEQGVEALHPSDSTCQSGGLLSGHTVYEPGAALIGAQSQGAAEPEDRTTK